MFDINSFVETAGYAGIAGVIFAETGFFAGFFFPGDTLLFTAGILASQGLFNIWILVALTTTAAILGDAVGYWSGKKAGPYIFTRPDSFWFSGERVEDAQRFFEKYGAVSIIIARFIPVVRTFTPIIAGVAHMPYRTFFAYNVIGAFLWAFLIPLVGYTAGNIIPDIERFLFPLILLVVLTTAIPFVSDVLLRRRRKKQD